MASSHDLPLRQTGGALESPGELVIQNGPLSGARQPLVAPLTLIGQATACHIRISMNGVSPLHCALIAGTEGLILQDLRGSAGTHVNGEPVAQRILEHGDLLAIGACRLRVRLARPAGTTSKRAIVHSVNRRDRDALRIQASAVAAQQAALFEEEGKLRQRRLALEQQEAQLSAHLQEKRLRLVQFRDRCLEARAALQEERTAHETRVQETKQALELARAEVADGQRQVGLTRRRMVRLRQRLKQRLHRHWQAERSAVRQQEAELAQERGAIDHQIKLIEKQREVLSKERLRFNGEVELTRRQLEAAREGLRGEQEQWRQARAQLERRLRERITFLDQRAAVLAKAERSLAAHEAHWNKRRLRLETEAEGLENRIRNGRRKLAELKANPSPPAGQPISANSDSESALPAEKTGELVELGDSSFEENTSAYQQRFAALDTLAAELADQRLHLAEELERLLQAQQSWQRDRDGTAAELEALAHALHQKEQALQSAQERSQEQQTRLGQDRLRLESWHAELTLRATTWEGERDRWLAELRGREEAVERRLQALDRLRQQWMQRRHQEVSRLREQYAALKQLRDEWATLRGEAVRSHAHYLDGQRELADRALTLQQYAQQYVVSAADPAAAEKQLEQIRRQCAAASASGEQDLHQERKALEAELGRLNDFFHRIHKLATEVAGRAANRSLRETSSEHQSALAANEAAKLRQELRTLRAHRAVSERQIAELRDEVERLARVLLDEAVPTPPAVAQAA
jgi:DNA repair exonuclease SbcCD ATPase subunit